MFAAGAKEALDCEIATMFYTDGLSFNLARNPHYIVHLIKHELFLKLDMSFQVTMLCALPFYQRREVMLRGIKYSWQQKGVSICSDGWYDTQRRPLINVMGSMKPDLCF